MITAFYHHELFCFTTKILRFIQSLERKTLLVKQKSYMEFGIGLDVYYLLSDIFYQVVFVVQTIAIVVIAVKIIRK